MVDGTAQHTAQNSLYMYIIYIFRTAHDLLTLAAVPLEEVDAVPGDDLHVLGGGRVLGEGAHLGVGLIQYTVTRTPRPLHAQRLTHVQRHPVNHRVRLAVLPALQGGVYIP